MATVTQIGAPAGKRTGGDKKKKRKAKATPTAVVVQAPAPVEEQKKRRRGRGRGRGSNDMMAKANLKDGAIGAVGGYAGLKFLGGKTVGGIPQTAIAGAAVAYFDVGGKEISKSVSTGLYTVAGVEYLVQDAIAKGKLAEFLAPQLGAKPAAAAPTSGDDRLEGIAERMANGG